MKYLCNTRGISTEIQLTDAELETQFLWYMRHFDNIRWKVSINSTFDAPLIVVHDTDGNESEADIVRRSLRTDYERLTAQRCHGTGSSPRILHWITCFTGKWTVSHRNTGSYCTINRNSRTINILYPWFLIFLTLNYRFFYQL